MPTIRITVDGKLALTVDQAAQRYGLKPRSMAGELVRLDQATLAPITFALDGKKKVYLASALDRLMKARPGRGARRTAT